MTNTNETSEAKYKAGMAALEANHSDAYDAMWNKKEKAIAALEAQITALSEKFAEDEDALSGKLTDDEEALGELYPLR